MAVITTSTRGPRGLSGTTGSTGGTGTAGSNGADGAAILHYDDSIVSNATNAIVELNTYTLPAAKLNTKGAAISLVALLDVDPSDDLKYVYVYINGVVGTPGEITVEANIAHVNIECYITRRSDSEEVFMRYKFTMFNEFYKEVSSHFVTYTETVGNLTTNTNVFSVRAKASGAGDAVGIYEFVITKYSI